ncbi:MAG: nucleotidyltransferase family protein [Thermoprotei archaeon]
MDNVKVAILAGGKGSRFKPYSDLIPKPLLPVGSSEKPLLLVIIEWLQKHGFKDYVLLVGYRWKYIQSILGDGKHHGVSISYSIDDDKYSGTGGALLKAYRNGLLDTNPVLVWYGDILAPLNPREVVETHMRNGVEAVIVVADKYRIPVGVAVTDDKGFVKELHEKPWLNLLVTIGVLTMNPNILDKAEEVLGTRFDIMADLIPWMIREGYRVKAHVYKGLWHDMGSFERYVKLDENLVKEMLR